MYKKLLVLTTLVVTMVCKSNACIWYDAEGNYYNLFSQEIMDDVRYKPFLLSKESRLYTNEKIYNGNVKEWQDYLGLSYDDTYYLVFKSERSDIMKLTKGQKVSDARLSFATPQFVSNHKQALLYISYVKYLEPYMRIVSGEDLEYRFWSYEEEYEHNAGELDYNKVKTVLTKSWSAESDKELKLRYGYQLVRFAHYTRRYSEAVNLFDTYVEPLGMKTEMYYYALCQKAGALRGMGEMDKSNNLFMKVFANSTDLKVTAYNSIKLNMDEFSFDELFASAADNNERNDIYLLMGYGNFNNPLNEIRKITALDPNAIQAKVLMVRAINSIERNMLDTYSFDRANDQKYPMPSLNKDNQEVIKPLLADVQNICESQLKTATDKNFWNLVLSYVAFLKRDYTTASNSLAKVNSNDEQYMKMVRNIGIYIEFCQPKTLNADTENKLFAKYGNLIKSNNHYPDYCLNNVYPTFIKQILINKYTLQSDKVKAFMVNKSLRYLECYPDETILNGIEKMIKAKNKSPMETFLVEEATSDIESPLDYISYFRGILRLSEGKIDEAAPYFANYSRLKVSKRIFGHNIVVLYEYGSTEMQVMRDDYINEFPFIHDNMTEKEVTYALKKLQSIASKNSGDQSAKAYMLMGNFFFNVSVTGYYRHYLRFDDNNGFSYLKFDFDATQYKNTTNISTEYLKKAMKVAKDDELRAHIAFALAKNAQQALEAESQYELSTVSRQEFAEFEKYNFTNYYDDVMSNCVYFREYKEYMY